MANEGLTVVVADCVFDRADVTLNVTEAVWVFELLAEPVIVGEVVLDFEGLALAVNTDE